MEAKVLFIIFSLFILNCRLMHSALAAGTLDAPVIFTAEQQEEFLKTHNNLRGSSLLQPTASNMECVQAVSNDLADMAQVAAEQCTIIDLVSILGKGLAVHFDEADKTPSEVSFDLLISYKLAYDVDINLCMVEDSEQLRFQCTSFKQAAWNRMTSLGCGKAFCSNVEGQNLQGYITVCAYDQMATSDAPYSAGLPCASCSAAKNFCNSENVCCFSESSSSSVKNNSTLSSRSSTRLASDSTQTGSKGSTTLSTLPVASSTKSSSSANGSPGSTGSVSLSSRSLTGSTTSSKLNIPSSPSSVTGSSAAGTSGSISSSPTNSPGSVASSTVSKSLSQSSISDSSKSASMGLSSSSSRILSASSSQSPAISSKSSSASNSLPKSSTGSTTPSALFSSNSRSSSFPSTGDSSGPLKSSTPTSNGATGSNKLSTSDSSSSFTTRKSFAFGIKDRSVPFSNAEMGEYIDQHNIYRRQLVPSGANLECVKKPNQILKLIAQRFADKCSTQTPDKSDFMSSSFCYSNPGVAIHYRSTEVSASTVLSDWLRINRARYDFTGNKCIIEGFQCNSFRQAAWHRVNEIGCGRTKCLSVEGMSNTPGYITVCVYGESASNHTQPYVTGSPCSQCAMSKNTCSDNLCCGDQKACSLSGDQPKIG